MNLKIYFEYAQPDTRYDSVVTCYAYPGDSNPIKIMAVEVINN